MGVVSSAEFRSLLSELDREQFVTFVADLWVARGMETTVVRDVGVASQVDKSVRVGAYYQRNLPWDVLPISGRAAVLSDDIGNVDILATNADSDSLRTVAEAGNVEYVGPDHLRRLCLYAIERDTAEDLFRRYFDRPVEREPVAETQAITGWDRVPFVNDASTDRDAGRVVRETGVAVKLVVVTAVVVTLPLTMLSAANSPSGALFDAGSPDSIEGNGPDIRRIPASVGHPPGIGHRTLENSTALISAHERALEDKSYRLTIRHNGTRGHLVTTARWQHSHQKLRKRSSTRYRFTVEGELPPTTVGASPDTVRFGVELRNRNCTSWTLENEWDSPIDPCAVIRSDETSSFDHVTSTYLDRYLDGKNSTVRVRRRSGRVQYRVVVTGPPEHLSVPTENYTAIALVDETGLVRALSVTYETPLVDRPGPVRFSFRFEEVTPARHRGSPRLSGR